MIHALVLFMFLGALCTPNQDEVRRELAGIEKRYKAADEFDEKRDLLEQAAALSRTTPDAPPPRVAAFLGKALDDDEPVVRETALRLLLKGQDPEGVVDALLDGWKAAQKSWKALDADLRAMNGGRGTYKKGSGISAAQLRAYTSWPTTFDVMIQSLGLVPDERLEKELVRLLKAKPDAYPGHFFVAACQAATALGSAKAMEAQVEFVGRLGAQLAKGPLERRYPRSGPMRLMDAFLAPFEHATREDYDRILDDLEALVAAKGLGPAPGRALQRADEWTDWFDEHDGAFVKKLGRLTEPVTVEPVIREDDEED